LANAITAVGSEFNKDLERVAWKVLDLNCM